MPSLIAPFDGGWIVLQDVAEAAGFKCLGADAARRMGLKFKTAPSADAPHGVAYNWVRERDAAAFVKHVLAQRADGRQRGFGYTAPAPGESSAALVARRKATKATVEALRNAAEAVERDNAERERETTATAASLDEIVARLATIDVTVRRLAEVWGVAL